MLKESGSSARTASTALVAPLDPLAYLERYGECGNSLGMSRTHSHSFRWRAGLRIGLSRRVFFIDTRTSAFQQYHPKQDDKEKDSQRGKGRLTGPRTLAREEAFFSYLGARVEPRRFTPVCAGRDALTPASSTSSLAVSCTLFASFSWRAPS